MITDKKNRRRLNILLTVLIVIILLPVMQQYTRVINDGKIHGVTEDDTLKPVFNATNWFDNSFQSPAEKYITSHIGFRTDFIHVHNQIEYSAFNTTSAHVVIGKHANLFEDPYINTYLGNDFLGADTIRSRLEKIKYVQDCLDKLGKKLLIVYAPSKVRFYPEDIPDSFFKDKKRLANYDYFQKIGDSLGVHQINFNQWFLTLKAKTSHLLFGHSGIHWTNYGALLAADSIRKYLAGEGLLLPKIKWDDQQNNALDGPNETEKDLQGLLNILFRTSPHEKFFHPELSFQWDSNQKKPKLIYIGDSFVWIFIYMGIAEQESSSWQYWSYYDEVWGNAFPNPPVDINKINTMEEVMKSDCVIIVNTEFNLSNLGNGFFDDAYQYFSGNE